MKLGFLTDIHFRDAVPGTSSIAARECRRMDEILPRCLDALVAAQVDLVVCAGDCVDEPAAPGVEADLATLGRHFAASGLPAILVPGNHDPAPERFYEVLPRPPRRCRYGDCEVITFFDDVWEAWCERARRSMASLELMRTLLGPPEPEVALSVTIQHYVVFPEHTGTGYRHTYENDGEIREILEHSPRRLVVLSGHRHAGHPLTVHRGVTYFTGRALCEHPYPYYILHTEGAALRVEALRVAVP